MIEGFLIEQFGQTAGFDSFIYFFFRKNENLLQKCFVYLKNPPNFYLNRKLRN